MQLLRLPRMGEALEGRLESLVEALRPPPAKTVVEQIMRSLIDCDIEQKRRVMSEVDRWVTMDGHRSSMRPPRIRDPSSCCRSFSSVVPSLIMTEDRRAPMESSFRTESQSFLRGATNCSEWPDKLLCVVSITASARRSALGFKRSRLFSNGRNALNSGHRDCRTPFGTATLARLQQSFGRDQHLGPQAIYPQGKELGDDLGDRLPRSRPGWPGSKAAFQIGVKESAVATCNLKSSAQPAAD